MADIKKLLEIRKQRKKSRPKFRRQGYGIYHRIADEWRKPRGRHSKLRHQSAGHIKKVKPGFRSNRLVRGLDSSGLMPVIIHSTNHISLLNKNQHSAIIGGNVGMRKRLIILNELKKHGITVINIKGDYEKRVHEELKQRKAIKESKLSKKSKKEEKKEHKHDKELTEEEKIVKEKQEKDKVLTKEQK